MFLKSRVIRIISPNCLEAFATMKETCCLNVILASRITPRSLTWSTRCNGEPFRLYSKLSGLFFLVKVISWHLKGLRTMRFSSHQCENSFNCCCRNRASLLLLILRNNFRSSANASRGHFSDFFCR